jgi:hypothetical protein
MGPGDASRLALARRLRALREQRWPDLRVTQLQIAEAFGDGRPLSMSLISSWESTRKPVAPPRSRLSQYATFFASRRSVEGPRARLLMPGEMTPHELAERGRLYDELMRLYSPDGADRLPPRLPLAPPGDEIGGGPFHFPDQKPVTIVCSRLPERFRQRMPYTDPQDPDYVRSYTYADIDSLLELFGHIRAVNPTVTVNIRAADAVEEDDYTAHLVLLGGVDWNPVTVDIIRRANLPVVLGDRPEENLYGGQFTVTDGEADGKVFTPELERAGDRYILREDIALVFRARNPYNRLRTLTLCNGMFGRGTYGAVRALTDVRFRDRNEKFLRDRFGGFERFSILTRVMITANGEAMTPDWTVAENRLHEWPPVQEDGE